MSLRLKGKKGKKEFVLSMELHKDHVVRFYEAMKEQGSDNLESFIRMAALREADKIIEKGWEKNGTMERSSNV